MTQANLKSSIQEIKDQIAGDGTPLLLFIFGGAILCIPFMGFLPLLSVCAGLVAGLATQRLLERKLEDLDRRTYDNDAN